MNLEVIKISIKLSINSVINNKQLTAIFGCAPQGGMRRSHATNTLVLISDKTGIYEDHTDGDIFHYTGMGQVGDQTLTSQNKTLAESRENGVGVHFFEVKMAREYTYVGEVKLVADPYIGRQKDRDGKMRNVWIFPLSIINNGTELIEEIEQLETELTEDETISETEKEQIVKGRIGQSKFKQKLRTQSTQCALCAVNDERFLIASHIKPWSESTNEERLDVDNGLLLCPNHDALFDKGYLSFDKDGSLLVSNEIDDTTRIFMNVNSNNRIQVTEKKRRYLEWHLKHRFKA